MRTKSNTAHIFFPFPAVCRLCVFGFGVGVFDNIIFSICSFVLFILMEWNRNCLCCLWAIKKSNKRHNNWMNECVFSLVSMQSNHRVKSTQSNGPPFLFTSLIEIIAVWRRRIWNSGKKHFAPFSQKNKYNLIQFIVSFRCFSVRYFFIFLPFLQQNTVQSRTQTTKMLKSAQGNVIWYCRDCDCVKVCAVLQIM